jgi:methionyl-tRNA formyltransferase
VFYKNVLLFREDEKMKILFMGNKDRGIKCLEALSEEDIVGVVAHHKPDVSELGSMTTKAEEMGIEVIQPKRLNSNEPVNRIRELNPDLIVMAGYDYLVGGRILDVPGLGCINLHGAKLPEYKGSSVRNWVLVNNEIESASTIIYAGREFDSGDILGEQRFDILPKDTIKEVLDKSLGAFPPLLKRVVREIKTGKVNTVPQDKTEACYYHSLGPGYSEPVDWKTMDAERVHGWVRALTHPYNAAYTTFDGKKLFLWKTSLLEENVKGIPGRLSYSVGSSVVVVAKDRGLLINRVQEEKGEEMSAKEYFKGKSNKYLGQGF